MSGIRFNYKKNLHKNFLKLTNEENYYRVRPKINGGKKIK